MLNKVPDIEIDEERLFDKNNIDVDINKISKLIPFKPMGINEGLKKYLSQLDLINLEVSDWFLILGVAYECFAVDSYSYLWKGRITKD